MKIWENKDFKFVLEKARKRMKICGAQDDMDAIYIMEKEIDMYRNRINEQDRKIFDLETTNADLHRQIERLKKVGA